jgi:hypothetical protein
VAALHLEETAEKADPEGEAPNAARQAWPELEQLAVVAHPAEPFHRRDPRASERAHVDAVSDVVLEVVDVHQRGLAQVVVRQLGMSDLGCDHRLRA